MFTVIIKPYVVPIIIWKLSAEQFRQFIKRKLFNICCVTRHIRSQLRFALKSRLVFGQGSFTLMMKNFYSQFNYSSKRVTSNHNFPNSSVEKL